MKALLVLTTALAAGAADLLSVRSEPNLERRARAALDLASAAMDDARRAYMEGDHQECKTQLSLMEEAVRLALASLKETGKNPSRSPRHFKNAEIRCRELLKRLNSLQHGMAAEERETVNPAIHTVRQVHEELLLGIMGKKK